MIRPISGRMPSARHSAHGSSAARLACAATSRLWVSRGVKFGHGMLAVAGAAGKFLTHARDEHAQGLRISVGTVAGRVPAITSAVLILAVDSDDSS